MFKRYRAASLLNVMGLSVAFAVFIVIATQLRHEFTYDASYKNAENIYRMEVYDAVAQQYWAACSTPIFDLIAEKMPEVQTYAAYTVEGRSSFSRIDEEGEKRFYSELCGRITLDFLDIFSMEVVAGDAKSALESPQQCMIPQSMAERIFGLENPIGKTILMNASEWEVGAIYKDFPKNSSVTNALFSKLDDRRWDMWSYLGFFQLTPDVDVAELNRKLNIREVIDFGSLNEQAAEHFGEDSKRYNFAIKPVKEIYFSQTVTNGYGGAKTGNKTMSYVIMLIGIIIMAIAYVNFTNFSSALAPSRVKGINTQRVMGASQGELRVAMMTEAAMISLLSFLLSLLWVYLFSTSALSNAFFDNPGLSANSDILVITGVLSVVFGLLAGAYPAVYMTSFQPALVLQGSFALSPRGIRLRNTLITIQFLTAVVLIVGASFIKLQHDYLRNRQMGMDLNNVVGVNIIQEKTIVSQLSAVANEIMESPYVFDYTSAGAIPGHVGMGWGRDFDGTTIQVWTWPVAHNFLRFFKIPVVEGNDFFEHHEAGANRYIFNKKTVERFDLVSPIGKEMNGYQNRGVVVGIAQDVNFVSLHKGVEPLVFVCGDEMQTFFLFLKVDAQHTQEAMSHIKSVCSKFGENEINVFPLDEAMDLLYRKEADLANIISLFSLIAIIISLMGIYGLIIFNAKFKVREIGIRKVNGASEAEIILLLNKGFLKIIALAFVIAVPVSWYMVHDWLKGFPYRVSIHWWVFVLAGIITILITLLTVSYQSWKAAVQNPVRSLKTE